MHTIRDHLRHSLPGCFSVRARNSKMPTTVKTATRTPIAHNFPLIKVAATIPHKRIVLISRALKDATREEPLLGVDTIVKGMKPLHQGPRNAKTPATPPIRENNLQLSTGTPVPSPSTEKSREPIQPKMKKTLQAFSVVLGLLATGSTTSLAEEDKGEKKPRAERGERGEGERRGQGQRRGGPRQVPKEILEKFDKNGDGKLDEDERKAAQRARRAEFIKKYDKDGDGELNEEERKAAMKDRRGRGGRPQGGRPEGGKKPGGKKPGGKKPDA